MPHQWHYSLIYGLCFGLTFFIRPNDAVAQIGGIMLGLSIWLIYKKWYKNLFENVLSFSLGFLLVALPIFIYFAYHDAIDDMLYGLVGFNSGYAGGVKNMLLSFIGSKKLALLLLFIILVVTIYKIKAIGLFVLVPMLSFQLILLGTNHFPHYYIVLIPIVLLYLVSSFSLQDNILKIVVLSVFCFSIQFNSYPR